MLIICLVQRDCPGERSDQLKRAMETEQEATASEQHYTFNADETDFEPREFQDEIKEALHHQFYLSKCQSIFRNIWKLSEP